MNERGATGRRARGRVRSCGLGTLAVALGTHAALAAAGCASTSQALTPGSALPNIPPLVEPLDLAQLASELETGPERFVVGALPDQFQRGLVEATAPLDDAALLRCAHEADAGLDLFALDPETWARSVSRLMRAVHCGETLLARRPPDPDLAGALERAYAAARDVLDRSDRLAPAVAELVSGLELTGASDTMLHELRERARVMHHRMAVAVLREGGPEVVPTLRALAELERSMPPAERVRLRSEVVRRDGDTADARDWAELASAHYANLDLARGDAALAEARRLSGESPDALAHESRKRAACVFLREVAPAQDVRALTDHARELHVLGRTDEADAELERLSASNPRDARPRAERVALNMWPRFADASWRDAAAALELEHVDRRVYEIALGVWLQRLWQNLNFGALHDPAQALARLDADLALVHRCTEAMSAWDPGRAAAIGAFVEGLRALVVKVRDGEIASGDGVARFFGEHAAALAELAARYPGSRDLYALALQAALSAESDDGVGAICARPMPAGAADARLATARAAFCLDTASMRNPPAPPGELEAVVASVPDEPAGTRAAFDGVRLALVANLAATSEAWAPAVTALEVATAGRGESAPDWLANNLRVAQARSGRLGAHLADPAVWDAAGASPHARFNAVACRLEGGVVSDAVAAQRFRTLVSDPASGALASLSQRWLQIVAGELASAPVSLTAPALHSVRRTGDLDLDWSFSRYDGFVGGPSVEAVPWLVCAPPAAGP